jgi:DNA-binding transcriptional regulator YiaG
MRRAGWRLFPADGIRTWDVGVRLGAALRKAYAADQTGQPQGDRAGVRGHVRRAHWHTYLSGAAVRGRAAGDRASGQESVMARVRAPSRAPATIRAAREASALTQIEAADLVHSALRSWQQWEAGQRQMHPGLWELFRLKALIRPSTQQSLSAILLARATTARRRPSTTLMPQRSRYHCIKCK